MLTVPNSPDAVKFKILYWGTPFAGKAANLLAIHSRLNEGERSPIGHFTAAADRTLGFTFSPPEIPSMPGQAASFHFYCATGNIQYNATLELLLKDADGLVFVIDSQAAQLQENFAAAQNLAANLQLAKRPLETLPLVLQYNKRDLPGALSLEELDAYFNQGETRYPAFEAVATQNLHVFETLNTICGLVLHQYQSQRAEQGGAASSDRSL